MKKPDSLRAASAASLLRGVDPIPLDFADDKWCPK